MDVSGVGTAALEEFDVRVDHLLQTTCEVARALVGAHQAAMGLIVSGDWTKARKYFSLSPAAPLEAAASFVVIEPA